MSKKNAPAETESAHAPKRKVRERLLVARVEALETQVAALTQVVDEAIRASIAARPKATEVKSRRRAQAGKDAPAGP